MTLTRANTFIWKTPEDQGKSGGIGVCNSYPMETSIADTSGRPSVSCRSGHHVRSASGDQLWHLQRMAISNVKKTATLKFSSVAGVGAKTGRFLAICAL